MFIPGSQLAARERHLYAFASDSIGFAHHTPSSVWLNIPVGVRPSIETHPEFSENQPPESSGDALPGELVFDLTYLCSDACAAFPKVRMRPFFTLSYQNFITDVSFTIV